MRQARPKSELKLKQNQKLEMQLQLQPELQSYNIREDRFFHVRHDNTESYGPTCHMRLSINPYDFPLHQCVLNQHELWYSKAKVLDLSSSRCSKDRCQDVLSSSSNLGATIRSKFQEFLECCHL
ncbi:GH19426 [Drosophila grimshawi]|uniref:GH19426 n=1 Tax=Drosophila grimshawi TaxID=7222 RepID=B4JG75_DROGR|nr:GH19426 [Drosophila grimshawi]